MQTSSKSGRSILWSDRSTVLVYFGFWLKERGIRMSSALIFARG